MKEFKVLSIDGGGIKGLYSARILERFENKFGVQISDHFDMICGTSTGGLIALALSLKIPASEICKFYEEEGPKIFPKHIYNVWPFGRIDIRALKQILWRGKYSDDHLKLALKKMFGERKIGESQNLLCIPSYTVTNARPWVFKYDHKENELSRDNKAFYVDVALATSAAPTYFPMAEISYYDNRQFIDGGVWSNNPTLTGYIEALSYYVGKGKDFDKLNILSISSLSLIGGKPIGLRRYRSFTSWRDELFETALTGQSFFTDYFMKKIQTQTEVDVAYFRIPSPTISSEQEHLVQLDIATPNALSLINAMANDMADIHEKEESVASFFKEQKIYKTEYHGKL